jgi:hypothetical protein
MCIPCPTAHWSNAFTNPVQHIEGPSDGVYLYKPYVLNCEETMLWQVPEDTRLPKTAPTMPALQTPEHHSYAWRLAVAHFLIAACCGAAVCAAAA